MKKNGFTLAEMLLTLAIVGTIASVSLSTLSINVQTIQLEAQFKKAYADMVSFAKIFKNDNNISVAAWTAQKNNSKLLLNEYKKYLVGSHQASDYTYESADTSTILKYKDLTNANGAPITAALCDTTETIQDRNGRLISFDDAPKRGTNGPRVCIDINGKKGPNIYGVDFFSFLFTTNGFVIPEGKPHANSNTNDGKVYDKENKIGYAWQAGTAVGPENCYDNKYGLTCAYYAQQNINPLNESQTYWGDFIGKRQYLK